jgi:hypothetical protein
MFIGETITGPKGGHIAFISSPTEAFEIHPQGDSRFREFYSQKAAKDLADAHAVRMNEGRREAIPATSLVRIVF